MCLTLQTHVNSNAFQSTHDYRFGCTQTISSDTGDDKISLGKGVATSITFYKENNILV